MKIYNLAKSVREALVKNASDPRYIPIIFYVGYEDNYNMIFKGNIQVGTLLKEGVDYVNELDCLDGEYAIKTFVATVVNKGEKPIEIITSKVPNLSIGEIVQLTPLQRPKVIHGYAMDVIRDSLDDKYKVFIDNEKLYVYSADAFLNNKYSVLVNDDTGLLSIPQRQFNKVSFDVLLSPNIRLNGTVNLVSSVYTLYNDTYRVSSISYSGDNYGSEWKQSVTGFLAG